jgi:1-acyl-sn-glycerol-3-phosphate acyltransferase
MLEFVLLVVIWFLLSVSVVFVAALFYGRFYWDGSESTGKCRFLPLRSWRIWTLLRSYFNLRIHGDMDLRGKRVLFVFYPHGLFAVAPTLSHLIGHPVFAGNSWIGGATVLFNLPIVREIALVVGGVSAERKSLDKLLKKQPHELKLSLCPGGMREALRTVHGEEDIFLGRTGFINLFEDHKFDMMVPVYVNGETSVFWTKPWLLSLRDFVMTHFRLPLLHLFVPLPLPVDLDVHLGKPCTTAEEFIDELLFLLNTKTKGKKVRFWTDQTTVWEGMESASSVRSAFLGAVSKRHSRADRPKQQ